MASDKRLGVPTQWTGLQTADRHDENISLVERVNKLVSFMQHIKEDETAKEQMQLSANSNFQVFWNQRKLYYYQNWNQIFDQICKGKDISRVVDSIYSRCNF